MQIKSFEWAYLPINIQELHSNMKIRGGGGGGGKKESKASFWLSGMYVFSLAQK